MSNNITENFEKVSGKSFDSFYSEVEDMLRVNFDPLLSDEENYENSAQLVQEFIANLVGPDYSQMNELSSFCVDKFYSEDK